MLLTVATPAQASKVVKLATKLNMSVSRDVLDLAAQYAPAELEGFKFTLMNYQREDLERMEELNGNCLLAWEQGLGKTCVFTAYTWKLKKFPALNIVPNSLKLNWRNEIHAMVGDAMRVNVIGKKYTKKKLAKLAIKYPNMVFSDAPTAGCDFYIINYDIVAKYVTVLEKMGFVQLGADESQKLKTSEAIRTTATMRLIKGYEEISWEKIDKKFKISEHERKNGAYDPRNLVTELSNYYNGRVEWADAAYLLGNRKSKHQTIKIYHSEGIKDVCFMSGTPMPNRSIELWTTVHAIAPHIDMFSQKYKFMYRFCDPQDTWAGKSKGYVKTFVGCSNSAELNELIKPFMIRRLKADVLPELPEKTFIEVALDFDRTDYDALAEAFEKEHGDYNEVAELFVKNGGNPPASLSGPKVVAYMKLREMAAMAKIDAALDWIVTFAENEKILVFCEHRAMVERIAEHVRKHFEDEHAAKIIYGGMDTDVVDENKVMFNNDRRVRVMVLNHVAGGTGHTLIGSDIGGHCSNVAIVEMPWTATEVMQDSDRAHRIGQKNAVSVWNLVAEDTVEGGIVQLVSKKGKDSDQIIDGGRVVNEIKWKNAA